MATAALAASLGAGHDVTRPDWFFARCPLKRSLIDKKNARRYDDCLKYTMVAGKKVRRGAYTSHQHGWSTPLRSPAAGSLHQAPGCFQRLKI